MIRLLRILGFLMMGVGALILLSYMIPPLRALWPLFLRLPLPIQIGLAAAAAGFLLVAATLLWERWEDREEDRKLREDL